MSGYFKPSSSNNSNSPASFLIGIICSINSSGTHNNMYNKVFKQLFRSVQSTDGIMIFTDDDHSLQQVFFTCRRKR
jgi:hypothetical protein